MQQFSLKHVLLVAALAAAANIAPLLMFEFGGDILFHNVLTECFNRQFWAGSFYPRWCFDANAGLGAPLFLFYFPLPYYATLPFWPLTQAGLSVEHIYILSAWVATFISALTAWAWLRDITTPGKALLGALLYLYMPYRMDVLLFRSGYAELWALAWLPLLCKYARHLVRGQPALTALALSMAAMFLSNMPAAMIGVLTLGFYTLVMGGLKPVLRYGLALLWASALAAFYLGPAILYKPFITSEGVMAGQRTWSNTFLGADNLFFYGQWHLVTAIALMLTATIALILSSNARLSDIHDDFSRREVRVWGWVFTFAFFLLFPISKPLWEVTGFIGMLTYPWRMQAAIMLAATYLIAIRMQWLITPRQQKTWKGDVSMLLGLLMLLALFLVSARPPDIAAAQEKILAAEFVTQREYRTVWTDKPYISMEYILDRQDRRTALPKTEILSGQATASVQQWDKDGIRLHIHAAMPATLRLDHSYFPLWKLGAPANATLKPEQGSGRMLLEVSAGDSEVVLVPGIHALHPLLVAICEAISLLALAAVLMRRRLSF